MRANPTRAQAGNEAIRKRTGKTWDQWFAILDRAGAAKLTHKEIVEWLGRRYPVVGDWWTQMLTVGYEQERGLRAKHQKPEGFEISKSKTFDAPLSAVWRLWIDEKKRAGWLKEPKLSVRTATPEKSIRFTWADGRSILEARFSAKGDKTQVTVQHGRLADSAQAERMKAFWGKSLDRLGIVLTK